MPRFSRAVALIGVLLLATPAFAQRLRLVADAWPPFTDSTLVNGGLATDIVTTAFAAEQTLTADTVPVNVDAVLFWMVHDAEKAALEVQDYAQAAPNLVELQSIGKSYEGREIWLLVVTNTLTGSHADKPALWVDGNIHAAELTASTACLYWLHQPPAKQDQSWQALKAVHCLLHWETCVFSFEVLGFSERQVE